MRLEADELQACRAVAVRAVTAAGAYIASVRPASVSRKSAAQGGGDSEASRVLTEVDEQSQRIVLETLADASLPLEPGVLSEERDDDGGRHERSHFWCVDPLDGTLPFVEGNPGYAVSVALVRRDGMPVVGAVFDPSTGRLFDAARGCGARWDRKAWRAPQAANSKASSKAGAGAVLHLFFDRSFVGGPSYGAALEALEVVARDRGLAGVRVHHGAGAVMNACGALRHAPACYLKLPKRSRGGGSVWDFAATACLAAELGASVSDASGNALALNPPGSTFMNERGVLFATDAQLARRVCQVVASLGAEPTPG